MILKMPNNASGGSTFYGCGDSYDSDGEESYILTPPSEPEIGDYSGDFSEYLWMENEEEFDQMEMQRLEEEALMEECMEAMLEDEVEAREEANNSKNCVLAAVAGKSDEITEVLSALQVSADAEKSTLNPLAAEFVPSVALVTAVKT